VYLEYLNLQRNHDPEHRLNLVNLLHHKYSGEKLDLIITVHVLALEFLLNEGRELFPGVPTLSYLVPNTVDTGGAMRPLVLMPMQLDMLGTLESALLMFPETRRVVVVNGVGEGKRS
jgi:hypothetical protein